jgi:hypothetical protein
MATIGAPGLSHLRPQSFANRSFACRAFLTSVPLPRARGARNVVLRGADLAMRGANLASFQECPIV